MMIRFTLALLLTVSCYPQVTGAVQSPAVLQFIREMETDHGFEAQQLKDLFDRVRISKQVLATISRPAEAKPWYEYRSIFVTPERTREGVSFWRKNAQSLLAAEGRYGVAPEVVVAIIGVETFYGRHRGEYRVADALSTLAFYYPKRADFFRAELKQFLLMAREQGVDALQLMGSYAGAMGLPQFISSSFRHYAVDFNHDGRIDIWDEPDDAIGSVANYLQRHGWERGRPVAMRAQVNGPGHRHLLNGALKPGIPWSQVKRSGLIPESDIVGDPLVTVVDFELGAESEYWLGFNNFYAITRYNHSALYAMAVFQLARAIRSEYLGSRKEN
ncbi:MAG: lytic murein transglycosylase B [Gammaproteobacteria bacterium]